MAHNGTLSDYRFSDPDAAKDDVRGLNVYGSNDEKLGKISDVIFDHTTGAIRYAIVDTGGWLHTKKFIVLPDRLRPSAKHEDDFQIDLTKPQIERFPAYEEEALKSEEKWQDYERRYRSQWEAHPIMHRVETDRNITPTTAQMTEGTGATGPMKGQRMEAAEEEPFEFKGGTTAGPAPGFSSGTSTASGPTSDAGVNRSVTPIRTNTELGVEAMGPGRRWSTFEDRLRQRRSDIIVGCPSCGTQPSSERLKERERKAG